MTDATSPAPRPNSARVRRNMRRLDARDVVVRARTDLVSTLNELEDKLNVSKQFDCARRQVRARADVLIEERPLVAAGIGVGIVLVVGGLVSLILRATTRR